MEKKLDIAFLILLFLSFSCGQSQKAAVEKNDLLRSSITETGELQAISSKIVTMPFIDWSYDEPKITELEKEGTLVKKGDVIGQLDTAGVVRTLGEKKTELAIAQADLEKMKADHESKMQQLVSDLQSTEAALRMAQIDTQRVSFESPVRREISRLRLQMAEIDHRSAKNKIKHTKIIQKEELQIQQQKINKTLTEIQRAQDAIEKFTLRAPADGLVEYQVSRRDRRKVQVGDNLWIGEPIIGLPDLSRMKVLTTVNETDIDKIQPGQKVLIRIDAFPEKQFEGQITKVARICKPKEQKSKIKVFDVEVEVNGSDPIFRPGMTVSCEILLAEPEKKSDFAAQENEFKKLRRSTLE